MGASRYANSKNDHQIKVAYQPLHLGMETWKKTLHIKCSLHIFLKTEDWPNYEDPEDLKYRI